MSMKPKKTKKEREKPADVAMSTTQTNRWVYLWSVTFNKDGQLSMQS
jgi:hypothetical protein